MKNFLIRPQANKRKRRVGRGGDRGKTSGKGHKGQLARAGHNVRPDILDQMQRIPKRRGYGKNRARGVYATRPKPVAVPLKRIVSHQTIGKDITPSVLVRLGICRRVDGRIPKVKIIGPTLLEKQIHISKCETTPSVRACVEAKKGTIV